VPLDSVVPDVEEDFDTHGPTLDQLFYDKLTAAFAERVKQCGPRVPVVTGGFFCCWEMGSHPYSFKASSDQCPDHYSGK
jgi:hypothetical protein